MHTTFHILAYCPQFFNYEFLFFVQYAEGGTKGHKKSAPEEFSSGAAIALVKRDISSTFSCSYGQLQTSACASGWG